MSLRVQLWLLASCCGVSPIIHWTVTVAFVSLARYSWQVFLHRRVGITCLYPHGGAGCLWSLRWPLHGRAGLLHGRTLLLGMSWGLLDSGTSPPRSERAVTDFLLYLLFPAAPEEGGPDKRVNDKQTETL